MIWGQSCCGPQEPAENDRKKVDRRWAEMIYKIQQQQTASSLASSKTTPMTQMAGKTEEKENINCSINLIALNEIKNSAVFQQQKSWQNKNWTQRIRKKRGGKRAAVFPGSARHTLNGPYFLMHTPAILFMAYLNMNRHNREGLVEGIPLVEGKRPEYDGGGGDKGAESQI